MATLSPAAAYPTLALGAGLAAVAAGSSLPDEWRMVSQLMVPALVMVGLWISASSRVPAGWERTSYAVAAVVTALMSTIFVWSTMSLGPVTVLAASVLAVALAGRHLVPLVGAAVVLALSSGSLGEEGTAMALGVAGALFLVVGARALRVAEPSRPATV